MGWKIQYPYCINMFITCSFPTRMIAFLEMETNDSAAFLGGTMALVTLIDWALTTPSLQDIRPSLSSHSSNGFEIDQTQ